jgi:hypothetical protein
MVPTFVTVMVTLTGVPGATAPRDDNIALIPHVALLVFDTDPPLPEPVE